MIKGLPQEVKHNSAVSKLRYVVKRDGQEVKPDSAPTIAVYSPTGTALVAATSMTMQPVDANGGRCMLNFDACTTDFAEGDLVTGGTNGAKGIVERVIFNDRQSNAEGILWLRSLQGTFIDDEGLNVDGAEIATANGASYLCEYYYTLDTTATGTHTLGEDYYAVVTSTVGAVADTETVFFDVVKHPFTEPLVTSEYIDELHPDWRGMHPHENGDWQSVIERAHRKLAWKIRNLGNRPALLVKREELFDFELAFVETEIASTYTAMPPGDREMYADRARAAWSERGAFKYDSDEDNSIDGDSVLLSSGFST